MGENNASKLNVVDNNSAADNDEDKGNATKVSPPRAKEVFMWATPVPVRRIVMVTDDDDNDADRTRHGNDERADSRRGEGEQGDSDEDMKAQQPIAFDAATAKWKERDRRLQSWYRPDNGGSGTNSTRQANRNRNGSDQENEAQQSPA